MDANTMAIVVLLGSFFLMVLLRFPIAYAVALSSVLCLLAQGKNLNSVCQLMVKGISSFSLMAVPFFITMGCLMGSGGISEKLIALANACVGWMRGGMAMVNIVASYFFGGISGSASADTASLGSILIPMMVDQGYDDDFSTAVTITSSCEGLLVPPSHNMVIYATTAGSISVGSLFLAGYLPGALLALSLMIGSYIISVKRNYPKGDKFSLINLFKQLGISFWALAAVLIVVFGVVGGVFTATEAGAVAGLYGVIIGVFYYKEFRFNDLIETIKSTAFTVGQSSLIFASTSVFSYCIAILQLPNKLSMLISGVTTNPYIVMFLMILAMMCIGCFMDTTPAAIIMVPIFQPLAASFGFDPIHFGMVMVLTFIFGGITPPVGATLFIASSVGNVSLAKLVKDMWPLILLFFIVMMLVAYVPQISTFLPTLIG